MKNIKLILQFVLLIVVTLQSSAQIGYQVSLLNSATGEPRVAETVSVSITLTNKEGATILQETQTATTNDFGILSLSVGNGSTFDDVDWSKLPFFISVSVEGKLVGKSQVLTVPVAEYAKRTGSLTKEILCSKTWVCGTNKYTFNLNGSGVYAYYNYDSGNEEKQDFTYVMEGNSVSTFFNGTKGGDYFYYYCQLQGLANVYGSLYK